MCKEGVGGGLVFIELLLCHHISIVIKKGESNGDGKGGGVSSLGRGQGRVYHRYMYTPRYQRLTHTHIHNRSVPTVGIPMGYEQGGRAKCEGYTSSGTMCTMVCIVPLLLYLLGQAWDA